MTLVTAGAMVANVAGYLLQLLAGRWLGVAGYSEFASLLAVQLLCAVPALALQNVIAREIVRGIPVSEARALGYRCAALVALLAAALTPAAALALHVPVTAAAAALVSAPILVLISADQGILQGTHRFRPLAKVLALTGTARVTPALLTLALGATTTPTLTAAALGLTLAALYAHTQNPPTQSAPPIRIRTPFKAPQGVRIPIKSAAKPTPTPDPAPPQEHPHQAEATPAAPFIRIRTPFRALQGVRMRIKGAAGLPGIRGGGRRGRAGVGAVVRAAQVQAALMALSSVDLIVARVVLGEVDASRYALGAIATKIAFWLPQAVGVVLYPRMARPGHSARAVRDALGVLAGIGVLAVVGAAVLAPLAPLFAGRDYAPIEGLLWLFALDGALLALLQGALLSAIAVDRTAPAVLTWVGLGIEIALALTVIHSLPALIALTTAVTATVTAALIAFVLSTQPKTLAIQQS
ncbi:polysaccharide biosynthesis protein [Nocardia sp. NPDC004068]|uniref:polysaccharide biosynthesis protein n=1 Tax=Nocardia sp. NPDC004068 TaxID=3364303 RepID=UPI0036991A54